MASESEAPIPPGRAARRAAAVVAGAALLAVLLAWISSRRATPTDDEPTYVGQGAYLVRSGDFYAPVLKWQPPLALYVTSAGLGCVDLAPGALDARPPHDSLTALGDRLLCESPSPLEDVLAASRLPVILAFGAFAALAARLGLRLGGERAGVLAGLLIGASPMFFSHGGLATTDAVAAGAALLATAPLALAAGAGRAPDVRRVALWGAALGVALLAKHTALVVAPVTIGTIAWLARRSGARAARIAGLCGVAAGAAAIVVWAGYGFHTGPLVPPDSRGDLVRRLGFAWAEDLARSVPVPAPSYWQSLAFQGAKQHDRLYFHYLGETAKVGWWTYFPVVTLGKATLGSVGLFALALWSLRRARLAASEWVLVAAFALPFGAAVASRHNLGVRHVLPAVAPLAVLVGVRASRAAESGGAARVAVAALAALHLLEGTTGVRDGVAWWNLACGGAEGGSRIAVQSNADWGQGFARLAESARALDMPRVHVLVGAGPSCAVSRLPAGLTLLPEGTPLPADGWLAVSTSRRARATDAWRGREPDHFLAGCFRVYRLPLVPGARR